MSRHRFSSLDDISDVDIDPEGRFKYVLIEITQDSKSKFIVRGYQWAEYHADIYDLVALNDEKFKSKCVGGGRIEHFSKKKEIHIFGYSCAFGQADHKISCELIANKYPDYKVTWSNDGY